MKKYNKKFEAINTQTGRNITQSEVENDLEKEGIDDADIKLLFKKYKTDDILNNFYNSLIDKQNNNKIAEVLNKQKLDKELQKLYKQAGLSNQNKNFYQDKIKEIKQIAINNGYNDEAKTIEKDIKREWINQNKKISIEDFIINNFCDFKQGKYIADDKKVVDFIRTFIIGQEESNVPDAKIIKTKEETALLLGFDLKRTDENYYAIQDEHPEEQINGESIGCLFRARTPLEKKDGSDVFKTGDWFWLAEAINDDALNFAKYILIYCINKKGLSGLFNAQELEQHLRNFDLYEKDFVDNIKEEVKELKTTFSYGKANNNELFDFAIIEDAYNKKIIGDKTVAKLNKMSDADYEKEKDKLEKKLVAYYLGFYKRKSKGLSYEFDQDVKDRIEDNISQESIIEQLINTASTANQTGALAVIEKYVAKSAIKNVILKKAGEYNMCLLDLDKLVDIGFKK